MADNYSPLPGLTGLPNQNPDMQGMTHYAQPTPMQQFEQQYPSITQYAHDVLSGSVAMGTSPYSVGGGLQGLADTLNNAQQNPEGLLNYIGFGALGTVENAGSKAAKILTELETKKIPEINPFRPAEGVTKKLYRETSPDGLAELLDGMPRYSGPGLNAVYAASSKDLALGQGMNKGITVDLNPSGFDTKLNLDKPAMRHMIQTEGHSELHIVPKEGANTLDYINQITLSPKWKEGQSRGYVARVSNYLKHLVKNGTFDLKEIDGNKIYTKNISNNSSQ